MEMIFHRRRQCLCIVFLGDCVADKCRWYWQRLGRSVEVQGTEQSAFR